MKYVTLIFLMMSCQVSSSTSLEQQHALHSELLGSERTYTVLLPNSYHQQTEQTYPVMFLLDGENNQKYSYAITGFLSENGVGPELITVAIHAGVTRQMDYLPFNPQTGEDMPGANNFLKFISKELMPVINQQYRVAPYKILSGHSYGGLFTTYAMLKHPELFDAYITQSPYFDQVVSQNIIDMFKTFSEQDLKKTTFYYFNLGDEPNLKQGHKKISEWLTSHAIDNFRWHHSIDKNKTHMTTRLIGQYEALEELFLADWSISSQQLMDSKAQGLKKHIKQLNDKYGFAVKLGEQIFTKAIQQFFSVQDFDEAKKTIEIYKEQHPKSLTAYFLAANAYGATGDKKMAVSNVNKAIELHEKDPQAEMEPIYQRLKQMKTMFGQQE